MTSKMYALTPITPTPDSDKIIFVIIREFRQKGSHYKIKTNALREFKYYINVLNKTRTYLSNHWQDKYKDNAIMQY